MKTLLKKIFFNKEFRNDMHILAGLCFSTFVLNILGIPNQDPSTQVGAGIIVPIILSSLAFIYEGFTENVNKEKLGNPFDALRFFIGGILAFVISIDSTTNIILSTFLMMLLITDIIHTFKTRK